MPTSPVLLASTTFFLNHSTGPSTVVCRNLNFRSITMENGNKIKRNLSNLSKMMRSCSESRRIISYATKDLFVLHGAQLLK